MNHPQGRQQRRTVRADYIARRQRIVLKVWNSKWAEDFEWGRYAKYNLNCGCKMCHSSKYFSAKRKRRRARQTADSQSDFRRRDKTIKY